MKKLRWRDAIAVQCDCPFCGKPVTVRVNDDDFYAWQEDDVLVQDAFPYLSPTERELFITGMCPDCQKEVFDSDDEYDEYEELADIDDDCGFDPYMGCFTDDC